MFAKSWRRLKLYKRLFTLCVIANVFCICLVMVLGFQYWNSKMQASDSVVEVSAYNEKVEKAQAATLRLSQSLKTYKKSKDIENELPYWNQWKAVQESSFANYPGSAIFQNDFYAFIKKAKSDTLFNYSAWLHEEGIKSRLILKSLYQESYTMMTELILIGGLTIVFGIILPMVLMSYIRKAIFSLKKDMESKAAKWVSQWVQAHSKDKKAFQSPEFWAKTLLFLVEEFGPTSRHPAMYYLSELSHTIRIELENSSSEAA